MRTRAGVVAQALEPKADVWRQEKMGVSASEIHLSSAFLFSWDPQQIGWCPLMLGEGIYSLLSLLIQMLLSSGNTLNRHVKKCVAAGVVAQW